MISSFCCPCCSYGHQSDDADGSTTTLRQAGQPDKTVKTLSNCGMKARGDDRLQEGPGAAAGK